MTPWGCNIIWRVFLRIIGVLFNPLYTYIVETMQTLIAETGELAVIYFNLN